MECKYPDQTGVYSCFSFQNVPKEEENQEVVVVKKKPVADIVHSDNRDEIRNHPTVDKRVTTIHQNYGLGELSTEMPVRIKHQRVVGTNGVDNLVDDPKLVSGHVKSYQDDHDRVNNHEDISKNTSFYEEKNEIGRAHV